MQYTNVERFIVLVLCELVNLFIDSGRALTWGFFRGQSHLEFCKFSAHVRYLMMRTRLNTDLHVRVINYYLERLRTIYRTRFWLISRASQEYWPARLISITDIVTSVYVRPHSDQRRIQQYKDGSFISVQYRPLNLQM